MTLKYNKTKIFIVNSIEVRKYFGLKRNGDFFDEP